MLPKSGFTLIELSIVLVIIGLVIGGVLVGQDLINAATIRAQISQIEKYNTAVNTFRVKYNDHLPGDIPDPDATSFGFLQRGTDCSGSACPGEGDGDGLIVGITNGPYGYQLGACNNCPFTGEQAMVWVDLSYAGLTDGTFNTATPSAFPNASGGTDSPNVTLTSTPNIDAYLPVAKLGNGNHIAAWSGGWSVIHTGTSDGINYFSITGINDSGGGTVRGVTVVQAYNIDMKIDDGLPQYGHVLAMDLGGWSGYGDSATGGPVTSASTGPHSTTSASATSCYDDNHIAGTEHYSMSINNGAGVNCALSFRFQ